LDRQINSYSRGHPGISEHPAGPTGDHRDSICQDKPNLPFQGIQVKYGCVFWMEADASVFNDATVRRMGGEAVANDSGIVVEITKTYLLHT
jgi:hypothetical protein